MKNYKRIEFDNGGTVDFPEKVGQVVRGRSTPIDIKNKLINDFQNKKELQKNEPFKKMSELGININEKVLREWRENRY